MSDLTDRIASDVRDVFLRTSDFAVEAALAFAGETRRISVLFDENFAGWEAFGIEVSNTGPAAICYTADVQDSDGNIPGEVEDSDDTLEVADVTHNITSAKRAGDTTLLILSKDAE